jgi:hypothetical protein
MSTTLNQIGRQRMLAMFADWTDRIAAGEVPEAPKRPQGIERNIVITEWDWADPKAYLHDVVSTDRRNPTLNPNGKLYGSLELSADYLPVLDPVRNEVSRVPLTVRDPNTQPTSPQMPAPSVFWGDEPIWTSRLSARPAPSILRRSFSRWRAPGVSSPSTTRRRRSSRTSAPVSARTI